MPFVNADGIARDQLGSNDPSKVACRAAQMAEAKRLAYVAMCRSFIFETVFSNPHGAKVDFLRDAQSKGYHIAAHYIGLHPPQLSIGRVQHRVASGGHDVPVEEILARYHRSLTNLERLIPFADELTLYDNSTINEPHRRVARFEGGQLIERSDDLPPWIHENSVNF